MSAISNPGVTSVGLALPSFITVSGSPVTGSGTLTGTLATQTANTIFAGPGTGLDAAPTFRSLVAADIPSLSATYLPLAGGTMTGNLLFTDNTLDIGADGATRPRTVYAGTSVLVPALDVAAAGALNIGTATATDIIIGKVDTGVIHMHGTVTIKMKTIAAETGYLIERQDGTDIFKLLDSGQAYFYNGLNVDGGLLNITDNTYDFGASGANRFRTAYLSLSVIVPTIGTSGAAQHALPTGTGDLVSLDATQTLTAKTLTAPVINGATSASGNFNLSGSTGTFLTTTGAVTIGPGAVGISGLTTLAPAASTSGSPTLLTVTGPAHTTLAASTEAIDVNLNLARTVQFDTGALATQRAMVVQAPTYGFVGASTLTNAATLAISGPPVAGTNATLTNKMSLWVQSGYARVDGADLRVTTVPGLSLQNNTAADVTNTKQSSPGLELLGYGWRGLNADSKQAKVMLVNRPNTPFADTTKARLVLAYSYDGGAYTDGLYIEPETNRIVGYGLTTTIALGTNIGIVTNGGSVALETDLNSSLGTAALRWNGVYSISYGNAVHTPTFSGTMNINATALGEYKRIVMTGDLGVWTMTAGYPGQTCTISFIQDGTGSRLIGTVPANVIFAGGALTLTTTASKRDNLTLRYDSTDAKWYEIARSMNM